MTPLRPMTHKRSALYMLAHDEWCSHDEANDGIECDCHLSVIASLRLRLAEADEAMRQALSDFEWAEKTLPGTNFQASILLLRHALAHDKEG